MRIPLIERNLPSYTRGEEIFHMAVSYTHLDVYKRQATSR